jgi:phospholipase/carboxylesterase
MVYQSNHWMEDHSGVHDVSLCGNRLSSDYSVQPQVEQDRVFLPLGYEPGYDYPLLVWLPQSNDAAFDLGRTMMRMSLRNYLAVVPYVPSDSESCFQAIDAMVDRYSVHPRRVYLVGIESGGINAFRLACQNPESFAGVVSVNGQFPVNEGLLGQFECVRSLPMMLCCDERASTANSSMARDVDTTLRLFHAAGGLLSLRVYRDKSKSRLPQVQLEDIVSDIDRWIMDEVCRVPDDQVTAFV